MTKQRIHMLPNDVMDTLRLYGFFEKPFRAEPVVGQEYVVVRKEKAARVARLTDIYPNCNTGNPTYQFEYGDVLHGTDDPHAWARSIIRGDVYYSLWTQTQ